MKLAGITSFVGPDLAPGLGSTQDRALQVSEGVRFGDFVALSLTIGDAPAAPAFSLTENAAWTERVAQNLSPLSESPSSVARAIRESYGRYLSARPRRFHAHA